MDSYGFYPFESGRTCLVRKGNNFGCEYLSHLIFFLKTTHEKWETPLTEIPKLITPERLKMIERVFDLMITKDDSPGLYELADKFYEAQEFAIEAEYTEEL